MAPLPSRTHVRPRREWRKVAPVDLTKRQQEIFDFIKRYSAKHGYPPTVRDIGKAVGLASSSTVHAHLANLEKLGLLRRDPPKPRALELLDKASTAVANTVEDAVDNVRSLVRPGGLPLVGSVAAGQPILAEKNIEESVEAPPVAGGDQGEYVLRIRGESMKDAGILEGEYVVVRMQEKAVDGDIVVALVGERAPSPGTSSWRGWERRHGSTGPSGRPPTPASSPRPRRWSRSAPRTCGSW